MQNFPNFAPKFNACGKMRQKIRAQTSGFGFQIFIERFLVARFIKDSVTIFSRTQKPRGAKIPGCLQIGNVTPAHKFFIFFDQLRLDDGGYFVNEFVSNVVEMIFRAPRFDSPFLPF